MELNQKYVIWGHTCVCGNPCSILQNKVHPWSEDEDFNVRMICNRCGNIVEINRGKAEMFYNNKIYSCFADIKGKVIDMGCGSGFLTDYIVRSEKVDEVYAIDKDDDCISSIESLNDPKGKIHYQTMDIAELSKYFHADSIDYIISRDVFMFIEETDLFFDDISNFITKGIKIMGWYMPENDRMKNKLHPRDICSALETRGWKTTLQYLDWYKKGYFISGEK